MRIMTRRSSESAILVQTAENEVDHSSSRKSFGMAKKMQCRETPIDAADAKMFGEMILQLIASLLWALVVSEHNTYGSLS